jgi:CRP-like cAMP-binding protein
VSIDNDIAALERVPALRLLGREALRALAIGAESQSIQEGETLFHAGDRADGGYVIQEGAFGLKPSIPSNAEEMIAKAGMLLGELALLAETAHFATAVARAPSTVLRISRHLFLKLLESYPDGARKLRDQMAARALQSARDIDKVRAKFDTGKPPR